MVHPTKIFPAEKNTKR